MTGLNWCCELPFLVTTGACLFFGGIGLIAGFTNDDQDEGVGQAGTGLVFVAFGVVMGGAWAVLRFAVN